MRSLHRTWTLAFAVVLLGGPIITADDAVSDAAIRARVKALETAWNARDAAGVAAVYAPDGDVIVVDGPRSVGRDAIRRSGAASWSGVSPERRISITVEAIRYLDPAVAIAECTAKFSAGEPAQDRATWVMVRQESGWSVAALRVMPAARTPK